MRRLPRIGQRVRYQHKTEYEPEPRVCSGVVTKIYVTHDFDLDGDDEPILSTERVRPIAEWQAAIKVDRPLPAWWAYGEQQDTFCPSIKYLRAERK